MDAVNVEIDDLTFDRANYDADGEVIGVTIITARPIIEGDGHVTITLAHAVQVEHRRRGHVSDGSLL